MKLIAVAFLSSIVTALLVLFIVKQQPPAPPLALPSVLSVSELRIVDDVGAVRMKLGTHSYSHTGSPALELLPSKGERAGAELYLDDEGKGTLLFSTETTDGKVMVGHFVTGDVIPHSQSDHSWGMLVLNRRPVKDAPYEVHIAATEGGNAYVSGVDIKQGPPPELQAPRAYNK